MEIYQLHITEFGKFMEAFQARYADLYQRYHAYLEMETTGTGRVRIKGNIEMRPVTRQVLTYIIKEYYHPLDN
jgi:hypothetical protein